MLIIIMGVLMGLFSIGFFVEARRLRMQGKAYDLSSFTAIITGLIALMVSGTGILQVI